MNHDAFMPHGSCFLWSPEVFWPMFLGHLFTAIAYFVLPLAMFIYWRTRRVRTDKWLERHLLFAVFVIFCGGGHLILVANLWHTYYFLEGIWACLTAGVSVWAAVVLLKALKEAPKRAAYKDIAKAFKVPLDEVKARLALAAQKAQEAQKTVKGL